MMPTNDTSMAGSEAERVYLVATGETHEGAETYTRHDTRPPLCDAEVLFTQPLRGSQEQAGAVAPIPEAEILKAWHDLPNHIDERDNFVGAVRWAESRLAAPGAAPGARAQQVAGWLPIATAPKDEAVLVYTPPQPEDWPDHDRIEIDCLRSEDDAWHNHTEHYEHFLMIGGTRAAGPDMVCTGPSEQAPYTHWCRIPAIPTIDAALQSREGKGVGDV